MPLPQDCVCLSEQLLRPLALRERPVALAADCQQQRVDAGRVNGIAGITPERAIREGDKLQEILALIEEDKDIAILILGAGTGKEGPGPLVSGLAKVVGSFPVPVAIVPGHLTDEELDAMS